MESMMTTQAMAPASFFYYSPDPSPENRQHGHFIPHPHPHPHPQQHMPQQHMPQHHMPQQHMPPQHIPQQPMHMPMPQPQMQMQFPIVPTVPSTPIYSRPSSSSSQPAHPIAPRPMTFVPQQHMTPMASPQPLMLHKPSMVLETEKCDPENMYYPSTPPMSTSSSVISSPGSCDMLATPLNPMFSGLDGVEGVESIKIECEDDQIEKFPVLDWNSCASPPLTPVYLHPAQTTTTTTSIASDRLSTASSCPSLSPSPAPYARSISSEQDLDFCDPRNLTVGSAAIVASATLQGTPQPAISSEQTQLKELLPSAQTAASPDFSTNNPSQTIQFTSPFPQLPASLEDFSDIESEEDFVNGLVDLTEQSISTVSGTPTNRSRASSDALSTGSCDSYSDFGDYDSCCSDDHSSKRQKIFHGYTMDTTTATEGEGSQQTQTQTQEGTQGTQGAQQTPEAQEAPANTEDGDNKEGASAPAGDDQTQAQGSDTPQSTPAPANRRGRKQSLTEDLTKTFICDMCNRRFRRQEHLKRHVRSLHTGDKPYACGECGKKFSRTDNLAQHARTHGAGNIPLQLVDNHDAIAAGAYHQPMYPHHPPVEDYNSLGKTLFQIAAEIPGSGSDMSSDEGSMKSSKKRKRTD